MIINSFFDEVHFLHEFKFASPYDYHLLSVNCVIVLAYSIEIVS